MIAGQGWPNGAVDNSTVLALPGPKLLLSSEHWHVLEVQQTHHVLYRTVPLPNQCPAKLKWSPSKYVDVILDQLHGLQTVDDLIPWNELDLQDERGDSEDDFQNLDDRYALIGMWGYEVIQLLRNYMPNTRIHWPAFTPNADHGSIDHVHLWRKGALSADVIDFHGYDTLFKVKLEHNLYRNAFPDSTLELTEFHGKGSLEQEQLILDYLKEQNLQGYFFTYRWDNAPGWWSTDYDIEHNPKRYELFLNQQEIDMPLGDPNEGLREYGLESARKAGLPVELFDRQIQQESGWKHWRPDGSLVTSSSNAVGVAQIIQRWHPDVDVTDPKASLDYAAALMASAWKRRGSYKLALMDYNWGPGNVNTWLQNGANDDEIRAQTTHYLDVILGPGWPEPTSNNAPVPTPTEPKVPTFNFGFKELADQLGQDIVGIPLTDETYDASGNVSVQYTTTGKMEYSKVANKAYFFLAARRS